MAAEGDRETNYWPGFVDALSNMVLAMIFIVLVLALAISMYAALAAKTTAERIASERVAAAELRAALAVAKQEAAAKAAPPSSDLPGSPRLRVPATGKSDTVPGARLQRQQNALIVEFEGASVVIDERTAKQLDQALLPAKALLESGTAEVIASAPAGFLTESRQTSFYRAMALRNFLIERGMAPARINVRVVEGSTSTEVGEVRVVFRASLAGAAP